MRSITKLGNISQDLDMAAAPQPRFDVKNTKRANRVAVGVDQWCAEVGDHGAAADRWMVLEHRVNSGVLQNHGFTICHGVLADGHIEWSLSDSALEELAVGIWLFMIEGVVGV